MSYDEKIVLECQENALASNASSSSSLTDRNGDASSGASSSSPSNSSEEETCSVTVPVGLYYNDVWEYDLNCTRCVFPPLYGGDAARIACNRRKARGCTIYFHCIRRVPLKVFSLRNLVNEDMNAPISYTYG